uniref:NADPH--hemoprotein reductase n=1 Tax=Chromera velia CCMP2878 TaxID=1169474 RepID=A0A0G4F0U4_9ALVE|eukprot:Cvel_14639.t1-p1 / transcript=Cvel_14639.t1 / gene=Cvel_14639 / organism=Chromera_velia_CCMP2878 / gene_product=NADPH--cytochrome P450 reductase 1, putative / transcript_product=NADPH--cytochrome P450 reductase 1, putative / location=Cvel_scaffold1048:16284-18928(+) / protein_length=725 / sequence_SO=supercontig / SO=protein_coding / is_pseudo=false
MDTKSLSSLVAFGAAAAAAGLTIYFLTRRTQEEEEKRTSQGAVMAFSSFDEAPDENTVFIYFGSQTGTAEAFAKDIATQAEERQLEAEIIDLEDFNPKVLAKQKYAVFLVATYGEGDPTDNAVAFHKWLTNKNTEADLSPLLFAVMGLGNRQYMHFNEMAKKVERHLSRFGARNICKRGEGDDDQDIEADFNDWSSKHLWPALERAFRSPSAVASPKMGATPVSSNIPPWAKKAPLKIKFLDKNAPTPPPPAKGVTGTDTHARFYFHSKIVPVAVDRELRQVADSHAGLTTKHVEFDLSSARTPPGVPSGSSDTETDSSSPAAAGRGGASPGRREGGLTYHTADNLDVLPENETAVVEWFAERLGVSKQLDSLICFEHGFGSEDSGKRPFPTPCSVRYALTRFCDLCGLPTKSQLRDFAHFVQDDEEKEALLELLGEGGVRAFRKHVKEPELSLREFMEIFMTSAEFDLAAFLQLCPRQKPRPYTISSSSVESPTQVAVTVSRVANDLPPLKPHLQSLKDDGLLPALDASKLAEISERARTFRGVCSSFLCCRLDHSPAVQVGVKQSSFRLPEDPKVPIIMVAAGTGLAPMRAFVRELRHRRQVGGPSSCPSEVVLFFGCQHEEKDYIYKDELQAALKDGILSDLVLAFSRLQAEKVYVQHRVKEHGKRVVELCSKGGYLFVCGGTAMGRSVREALEEVSVAETGSSTLVDQMGEERRIVEELWA